MDKLELELNNKEIGTHFSHLFLHCIFLNSGEKLNLKALTKAKKFLAFYRSWGLGIQA